MPPIIDLIIQIKNAYASKKSVITLPHSTFKEAVLKKLVQYHYIVSYEVKGDGAKKDLEIELLYKNTMPAITGVKLFSKPGRRVYTGVSDIAPVLGGMGRAILSTPQGVLTDSEARKIGIGGELLFYVW